MSMRFFEIICEQETGLEPPVTATKAENPIDQTKLDKTPNHGSVVIDGIKYASKSQQKSLVQKFKDILTPIFPVVNVRNDSADPNAGKQIPSIRILNALPKETVLTTLKNNGYDLKLTNTDVQMVSGTYRTDIYSYQEGGIVFTVVIAGKRAKDGNKGAQIGIQMLRPEKFGLKGVEVTRSQMAALVKEKIPKLFGQDPLLGNALTQLVDVAMGKRKRVDQELMDHISSRINLIAQDFGEVLTPLAMTKDDSETISFSSVSNKPLIDVIVKGQPIAVKSLSGSGNSFAAIKDMINKYEDELKKDPNYKETESMAVLKDFVNSKDDLVDKIIRAAQRSQIPEVKEVNRILGVTPKNYAELESAVSKLVDRLRSVSDKNLYKRYLETIYPASIAAGKMTSNKKNPKPVTVGLPKDWSVFVKADAENEPAQTGRKAGKKMFDANFVRAASRQITYMLGMGFKNLVVEGDKSQEMADTLKNIMTKQNASVAHIVINSDGSITVKQVPFSQARFGYQYHAGTDTVNQNGPGFHYKFN